MTKPIVLVTGQHGQLGNELKKLASRFTQFNYVFTDVMELDITDRQKVDEFFEEHKPAICINAAAYTAVDKAETEKELTLKINAEAVGHLAENCAKLNARLVHISTDYVFDGTASTPYSEDHTVSPVNFYGESKLKGEQVAMQVLPSAIIIRTSWVYSFFGNNFVKTMMRLMNDRDSLQVINDQYGSPTYAADLAEAIMQIASNENFDAGVYHYSNEGVISWFDFAVAIRDIAGLKCDVKPTDTAGYPTPAKRPGYSVMNKQKIISAGIPLKNWKDSLQTCITLLQQ